MGCYPSLCRVPEGTTPRKELHPPVDRGETALGSSVEDLVAKLRPETNINDRLSGLSRLGGVRYGAGSYCFGASSSARRVLISSAVCSMCAQPGYVPHLPAFLPFFVILR